MLHVKYALNAAALSLILGMATKAHAIAELPSQAAEKGYEGSIWLEPAAHARAQVEIQVRRLNGMIKESRLTDEDYFQQMSELRRKRAGTP